MMKKYREKFQKLFKKNKYGFTLVELVMVIVIIGLLSAIIVPKFADQRAQASISATRANLESLRTAIALFSADNNAFPAAAGLVDLIPPTNQYLRAIPHESMSNPPSNIVTGGICPTGAAPGGIGWLYDSATGNICVNNSSPDTNGDMINLY